MSQGAERPVVEYGKPERRRVNLWAMAAPFVALGAFVLAAYLGASLVSSGQMKGAYAVVIACPVGAIGYSIYALRRGRQFRGAVIGSALAILSICFSCVTGLLCPGFTASLEASRHMSGTTVTSGHISSIVKACQRYAGAHGERFPPHLAVLVAAGEVKPGELLDLNAPVPLAPLPGKKILAPSDWAKMAADVDAHTDLEYVGADLVDAWDSELIVLYTKAGRVHKHMKFPEETWDGEGRVLGFADGHVEMVLDADLPGAFAKSNAVRAKKGLPKGGAGGGGGVRGAR